MNWQRFKTFALGVRANIVVLRRGGGRRAENFRVRQIPPARLDNSNREVRLTITIRRLFDGANSVRVFFVASNGRTKVTSYMSRLALRP